VGLLIVLIVLPSALNFPQSNPTETLEYAPVPPQDSDNPPPQGNIASLGLGRTSGISEEPVAGAPAPTVRSDKPVAKRCVGNPPRQTEDAMAPPCVAFFEGDNFGATYQGVTREEIRILIYVDGNYNDVGTRGILPRANGKFYDLAQPPEEDENYYVEAGRIWQRYFNERYQTYGRFAHFWVTFGTGQSPEARRADAAEAYSRVRPFAVITLDYPYQSSVPFVELMAKRGVLTFGIVAERPESLYQQYPKLEWSYWPSLDKHVRQFSDYVCSRIIGKPVSFGGNDGDPDTRLRNGQPRRLGLLSTTDPNHVTKQQFAKKARAEIEECGGNFVEARTFPGAGFICCNTNNNRAASDNAVAFKNAGVTTIIYAQGYSPEQSQGAGKIGYLPEWVVAGDRQSEDIVLSKYQDQAAWDHALMISNVPLVGRRQDDICYMAAKETEPDLEFQDGSIPCRMYDDLRQLFTGIQVAGPRLGPTSIDRGLRAIPNRPSGTPSIPACFYEPGDYTCVKDSIEMYWDSQATSRYSGTTGCYRATQGGKRYLVGSWPTTDPVRDQRPNDPCNAWTPATGADPSPGPDTPPPQ
jgi:hypothetical protein